MKVEALKELAAKVEAGQEHETFIWKFAAERELFDRPTCLRLESAYGGSLDAAKALHDAVLPGWEYGYDGTIAWVKLPGLRSSFRHDNRNGYTSRAWLLAILKALIAEKDQ